MRRLFAVTGRARIVWWQGIAWLNGVVDGPRQREVPPVRMMRFRLNEVQEASHDTGVVPAASRSEAAPAKIGGIRG